MLFFLCFGESAPCKSYEEAKRIPIDERNRLVEMLSETYKNQQEEMEKSKNKGKSAKRY